ncbi:MAG: glycosyltransferase [Chloroflexota bacterium]|nr:glycosyltransferase [Chloroflexota bacterium]
MSHIVVTWELGSHLGHISRLLPLALKLKEEGDKVSFILKDLSHAYDTLVQYGFSVYQAPVWLYKTPNVNSPPANFAEILILFGYLNTNNLSGMVAGWRCLYEQLQPDLVLFDHSPTALLAARSFSFKKALFGSGFFHPLHTVPTPDFRPEDNIPSARLQKSEQRVLKVVNEVLANYKTRSLEALYELFEVDEDFLITYPELDHYQGRPEAKYWGTLTTDEGGIEPVWPGKQEPAIFAYLKPEYSKTPEVLKAISETDCQALIFSPNLPQTLIDQFSGPRMSFSKQRYQIRTITRQCDLAICHAGHDTVTAVLMAGKPLFMLPMQQEQMLLARNVEQLGAGISGYQDEDSVAFHKKLQRLVNDPTYARAAQNFSAKYAGSELAHSLELVTRRCLELLSEQ